MSYDRIQGSRFKVQDSKFKVQNSRFKEVGMATMASKIKEAGLKNNKVTVKRGRKIFNIEDDKLKAIIIAAKHLQDDVKSFEPTLKEYKKYIASAAKEYLDGSGSLTFEVKDDDEVISCRIVFGYECIIPDDMVDKVKEILGDRFFDLIKVKREYHATKRLVEMVCDGEEREVGKYIVIKEKSPIFEFKGRGL